MGLTSDYDWGSGLQGAGGGALAGAAVGGPAGAAIGGGLGLLSGFWSNETPGEADAKKKLQGMYSNIPDYAGAANIGPTNTADYSGFRQNQVALVSRLEAMANGQGPSLAKQQFEQATDRNMRGQQAMAASGRGGPLSQLTAANNMAMLGANAAQGSAIARTGEELGAINQLGGVISQGRSADEGVNTFNAGQKNQMQIQQVDARLRAMGMADDERLRILAQMQGIYQAQAARPTLGQQVLAGGAGMYSMGATQAAQQKAMQSNQAGQVSPGYTQQALTPPTIYPTPYAGNSTYDSYIGSPNGY